MPQLILMPFGRPVGCIQESLYSNDNGFKLLSFGDISKKNDHKSLNLD